MLKNTYDPRLPYIQVKLRHIFPAIPETHKIGTCPLNYS